MGFFTNLIKGGVNSVVAKAKKREEMLMKARAMSTKDLKRRVRNSSGELRLVAAMVLKERGELKEEDVQRN